MVKTNLIPRYIHISSDPKKCWSCGAYHEDKKLCELHNEKVYNPNKKGCADYEYYMGAVGSW